MPDSWSTTSLANSIKPVATTVNTAISAQTTKINNLAKSLNKVDTAIVSATNALTISKTYLTKLNESGLYTIALVPKKRNWINRLSEAKTDTGSGLGNPGYSTGFAIITISSDPSDILVNFQKMIDVFDSVVEGVQAFPELAEDVAAAYDSFIGDLEGIIFDEGIGLTDTVQNKLLGDRSISEGIPTLRSVTEINQPSIDKWESLTIGDVLGGYTKGLKGTMSAATSVFKDLINNKRTLTGKARSVTTVKNTITATLTKMNLGVSSITLAPGPGSFISRLQAASNKPTVSNNVYSAGVCGCAISANIADLGNKWDILSTLM